MLGAAFSLGPWKSNSILTPGLQSAALQRGLTDIRLNNNHMPDLAVNHPSLRK